MNTYYVWITAMFEGYADAIVADLVRNKFVVSALSDTGIIARKNSSCSIIALQVQSKLTDVSPVIDEIKKTLEKTKTQYYSLLVSAPASCVWNMGNIVLPETVQPSHPIDALT